MLAVVSPQPTPALPPSAAAIYSMMTPQPLVVLTPQRLQSPILPRHAPAFATVQSSPSTTNSMDTPPDALDLADIADLSQLVVDEPSQECGAVPLAAGPIRRRKTSLRASPLLPKAHTLHETTPQTPISHVNPSRITFHNLMPVFSCDPNTRS
ncbi:hypothetical protein MVEN_02065400 [Mycena venus]|uniref:Uncharacterized protein n=1 Tax=Mycena venus TaxID=2733690 RepID=A0A8H7CJM3_9AGAR|nr:hypothetical protein MVEN_02065400 [Mycena venus]